MPNSRILFISTVLFLAACSSQPSREVSESNNLVLNLFGDNTDVTHARVNAALEAIGGDGILILDYAPLNLIPNPKPGLGLPVPIEDIITSIPVAKRSHVLLTSSSESYPWIRDSLFGWMRDANGKYQLGASTKGNQSNVFSAPALATLLNSCEDSSLLLPQLRPVSLQESMVENNGDGICVVNSLVPDRLQTAGDETLLAQLGCNKVILALNWQDWRTQGHTNGHIDISVSFLSPRVAVIPALDPSCKTDFKTGWSDLRASLTAAGIQVLEIPIVLGCISRITDDIVLPANRPLTSGVQESDFALNPHKMPAHALIGSYSNMVVLKNAILLPEFLPPPGYVGVLDPNQCAGQWRIGFGCPVGPSTELSRKYLASNERAVSILTDAMKRGLIPQRKIIPFPIPFANAISGGAVHCMTFQVPGSLNQCTQSHLDSVLQDAADKAIILSNTVLASVNNKDLCRDSANTLATLNFMADKVSGRDLSSAANPSDKIIMNPEKATVLRASAAVLEAARNKNCAGL